MGGPGSGIWPRTERKETVDKCLSISVSDFTGKMNECITGCLQWVNDLTEETLFSLDYLRLPHDDTKPVLVLAYKINNDLIKQYIHFQSSKPFFGGMRWWLRCPLCNRRVKLLYMPHKDSLFACRICHRLAYRSCRRVCYQ